MEPKTRGDEDKLVSSIHRLTDEDPTLVFHRDDQTREMILSGLGQVHIEVTVEKMKRKFGLEVNLKTPKVPYKETIKGKTTVQGRYKKQSGGRGQFGDTWLEIEPLPRGGGFEFVDRIVGGVIPHQYRPAVEKGIVEAMAEGVVAGYPVVDLRVSLVDGSYHTVDSSEMAFKIAGSLGFKKGVLECQPTLLEPIVNIMHRDPRRIHGRRHRRSEQPPRQGSGDGFHGSPPDHQGSGPPGRDPQIRPRSPFDDERPRNLHLRTLPLRGGSRPTSPRRSSPNPRRKRIEMGFRAVIITVSDRGARGEREDRKRSGDRRMLEAAGMEIVGRRIIPDEKEMIRQALMEWSDGEKADLILTTGGTGVSPRDVTPDATREVIEREIPGMAEAMRRQSAAVTPHAMISRALAGIRGRTLIINLPGSPKGARENLSVLLPALPHAIEKIKGDETECAS